MPSLKPWNWKTSDLKYLNVGSDSSFLLVAGVSTPPKIQHETQKVRWSRDVFSFFKWRDFQFSGSSRSFSVAAFFYFSKRWIREATIVFFFCFKNIALRDFGSRDSFEEMCFFWFVCWWSLGIRSYSQMMIGVFNRLRNAWYLGSMKPFSEGDWMPREVLFALSFLDHLGNENLLFEDQWIWSSTHFTKNRMILQNWTKSRQSAHTFLEKNTRNEFVGVGVV